MPISPTNNAVASLQVVEGEQQPFVCVLAINPVSLTQLAEMHTVPASSPYQLTIAPPNGDTFLVDLGVVYTGSGTPLTRVGGSGALSAGQYQVQQGLYIFAAADAGQGVSISYTHSNGVSDVSYTVKLTYNNGPEFGGAMRMNPTDQVTKLLYKIRGSCLELMKQMTWRQYLALGTLSPGFPNPLNNATAIPAPGAGILMEFPVDVLAILTDNPASMGL